MILLFIVSLTFGYNEGLIAASSRSDNNSAGDGVVAYDKDGYGRDGFDKIRRKKVSFGFGNIWTFNGIIKSINDILYAKSYIYREALVVKVKVIEVTKKEFWLVRKE